MIISCMLLALQAYIAVALLVGFRRPGTPIPLFFNPAFSLQSLLLLLLYEELLLLVVSIPSRVSLYSSRSLTLLLGILLFSRLVLLLIGLLPHLSHLLFLGNIHPPFFLSNICLSWWLKNFSGAFLSIWHVE